MLSTSTDDYLWYVDQALDAMVTIVSDLGDDLANERPPLAGANSPYVILTHCLGVLEFWGGAMVAGRAVNRDRDAEFRAAGPVSELVVRTAMARRRLADDLVGLDPLAAPARAVRAGDEDGDRPLGRSRGGVLLHVLEELYQHLGQMEISRDVLRAGATGPD